MILQSEYGGEMWWCCGKTQKDAPGCLFSKHECKEDEDDDEAQQEEDVSLLKNKNIRCHCCKLKGHLTQDCPRDPNIKTSKDPNEEFNRVIKAKNFRKLLSDSLQMTSKFFRGLIRKSEKEEELHPFSKGSLAFDDYSYRFYNNNLLNPRAVKQINEEEYTPVVLTGG